MACWTWGSCAHTGAKQTVKHYKAERNLILKSPYMRTAYLHQLALTSGLWPTDFGSKIVSWTFYQLALVGDVKIIYRYVCMFSMNKWTIWNVLWKFGDEISIFVVVSLLWTGWLYVSECWSKRTDKKNQCFHHNFSDLGIFLYLFSLLFDKSTKNLRKMEFFHLFICFLAESGIAVLELIWPVTDGFCMENRER